MNIDKKEVNRLVMRLKEGDETAFDRLYSLLKLPLLKFVNGYTGNADASDDIVHNVFLCLYSRPIKKFFQLLRLDFYRRPQSCAE